MASINELIDAQEKNAEAYFNYVEKLYKSAKEKILLDKEVLEQQKNIAEIDKDIDKTMTHTKIVLKKNESLCEEIGTLEKDVSIATKKCDELKKGLTITEKDSIKLAKAKNMWHIGEKITGVKWDYSAPDNIVRGYVVNKDRKTINLFEFSRDKHSDNFICNELWNRIETAAATDWSDIRGTVHNSDKENKPVKKH